MTARERRLCDCDEPGGCYAEGYAAGKDKAFFEVITSLEGPPHAQDCGCQPCQVKRACLQKVMTLMARSSPGSSSCWRSGRWRTLTTGPAGDHDRWRMGDPHDAGQAHPRRPTGNPWTGPPRAAER